LKKVFQNVRFYVTASRRVRLTLPGARQRRCNTEIITLSLMRMNEPIPLQQHADMLSETLTSASAAAL
jgi:hypothetical protein